MNKRVGNEKTNCAQDKTAVKHPQIESTLSPQQEIQSKNELQSQGQSNIIMF